MTDEQLDRATAEPFGWHVRSSRVGSAYFDANGHFQQFLSHWHPTTDLNQGRQLLDSLGQEYIIANDSVEIEPEDGKRGAFVEISKENPAARAVTMAFLRAKGVEVK